MISGLEGKTAFVTGAASGIGAATAGELARQGAYVYFADIRKEEAEIRAAELHRDGYKAEALEVDVSDHQSVHKAVDTVAAERGVDILVNCAGINDPQDRDLVNTDVETWDRLIRIDLNSVFYGCKYAIPHMLRKGGGSIINISSMLSLVGSGQTAYGTVKAAVNNLTRNVAMQYGKQNIRANAILPGVIETPMTSMLPDALLGVYREANMLPRLGKPEDVAKLTAFLASDGAGYITGQCLVCDGGYSAAEPSMYTLRKMM